MVSVGSTTRLPTTIFPTKNLRPFRYAHGGLWFRLNITVFSLFRLRCKIQPTRQPHLPEVPGLGLGLAVHGPHHGPGFIVEAQNQRLSVPSVEVGSAGLCHGFLLGLPLVGLGSLLVLLAVFFSFGSGIAHPSNSGNGVPCRKSSTHISHSVTKMNRIPSGFMPAFKTF